MPEISIIVAVYNAEAYICRCLNSILTQTFTDFEVLLIDDGSTDKSGKICDDYAENDSRFKVIHKENEGVASARQCGIEEAKGTFSINVDPDDWIEPDCLELMYNKILGNEADIVCCSFITEYENNSRYVNIGSSFENRCKKLTWGNFFVGSLINKLIRHDLYKESEILIPKNYKICEDSYVLIKLLERNPKIVGIDKYLYHYDKCVNSSSVSENYDLSYYYCQIEFLHEVESLHNKQLFGIIKDIKGNIAHSAFYYNIFSYRDYVNHFKGYIWDIILSSTPIHKKVNIILSFLGLMRVYRPIYKFVKFIIKGRLTTK